MRVSGRSTKTLLSNMSRPTPIHKRNSLRKANLAREAPKET
jgi:hypothetical protein